MKTRVLPNTYRDSGTLMSLAARLQEMPGVTRAAAIMATPRNVELLRSMFDVDDAVSGANPSDLLVVAEGEGAEAALANVDALLAAPRRSSSVLRQPQNFAVISVPGPFAAREARRALRDGLHVFLFSNGVALEDEIALKREARQRGLLLMGPDCGTAIIDGIPIGFANRVRRGAIGVVGASGTGIQEITTLVHRMGRGISHAIGTGSRDLSDDVGGMATLHGIELLARDAATEVIVIVSKPPSREIASLVVATAHATRKRVVSCFVGGEKTLEDAAFEACGLFPDRGGWPLTNVVGLFSGGTLASEARAITGGDVVDLGGDEFTRGRPHPMIDPTIRIERIRATPQNATLLLDVVLGEGAHPDPAGALVDAIRARGGVTVASVCGTDDDPQNRARQVATLREAGVTVCRSNAAAARGDERDLPTISAVARNVSTSLLGAPLVARNLGLSSFADTLEAHGVPVARVEWKPPAGGDEELARILDAIL